VIVLHSEIYNFLELARLEAQGAIFSHPFGYGGLLAAWRRAGRDVLALHWHWALAIYDTDKGFVFCPRARPLRCQAASLLECRKSAFVFASEQRGTREGGLVFSRRRLEYRRRFGGSCWMPLIDGQRADSLPREVRRLQGCPLLVAAVGAAGDPAMVRTIDHLPRFRRPPRTRRTFNELFEDARRAEECAATCRSDLLVEEASISSVRDLHHGRATKKAGMGRATVLMAPRLRTRTFPGSRTMSGRWLRRRLLGQSAIDVFLEIGSVDAFELPRDQILDDNDDVYIVLQRDLVDLSRNSAARMWRCRSMATGGLIDGGPISGWPFRRLRIKIHLRELPESSLGQVWRGLFAGADVWRQGLISLRGGLSHVPYQF